MDFFSSQVLNCHWKVIVCRSMTLSFILKFVPLFLWALTFSFFMFKDAVIHYARGYTSIYLLVKVVVVRVESCGNGYHGYYKGHTYTPDNNENDSYLFANYVKLLC